MRAIITRPNLDNSYDEVGMNNRISTKEYKTIPGIIKNAIPKHFKGKIRIELYQNIYAINPIKTIFVERN